MRDANPQTIYLKDYSVPEFLIHEVNLNFNLDDAETHVVSTLTLRRNPKSQSDEKSLTLMGENIELIKVSVNDKPLSSDQYHHTETELVIHRVPQDKPFLVTVENIINPSTNTALEGLYLSKSMLCTQCEAEGFRKITYFLDRPDVMSRFTTTLTGDKLRYPVMLSNGNKIDQGDLPDNRHWVTWEDPFNKPCYLFALVAGQLKCIEDTFTTMSGREICLQIFVEEHDLDKCAHAMQSLKNAMRWDEEVYGREYDLDLYMIVAVGHFNMGAMENKGLNVFNTKFVLARPDTATDADYEHIEGVIGHEYFHNWSGNRVTCRDWFQLSLKEGFTVFRDQEFTSDRSSRAVKRIEDVNMLRTRQFAEDAGPMAHPIRPESYIEINNFYTLTVYEKGAEVVRMLHTLLGAEGFRKGCDLYFDRHDGQAVTCDDFVRALEEATDTDLSQFRLWYSQAGTPVVSVQQSFDEENKKFHLTLNQSCPPTPGQKEKKPMLIPVRIGLLSEEGESLPCLLEDHSKSEDEIVLRFTEKEQAFTFSNLSKKPIVSLFRGFSAPVKQKIERSLDELIFLMQYDVDPFNRWEAKQQLETRVIMELRDKLKNGQELSVNQNIIDCFRHLLVQDWDDLSYFALLINLPSEIYLAEQMDIIDVDGIHTAREHLKTVLVKNTIDEMLNLYQTHHKDESGNFEAKAIGRRRIKNTCLSYLVKTQQDNMLELASEQYHKAGNMTDQIASLSELVNENHPKKDRFLNYFYQQWRDEALVIDKWFAIQASSSAADTFQTITGLLNHSAFDLKNPNRVRSLIGAFSQNNPVHYHAVNGQGYRFLANQIIALNSINPQVASRMMGALTPWRRFDKKRQELMKQELERIMATKAISKDVYEIASKSLA